MSAPKDFNELSEEPVPEGTIRQYWDGFSNQNFAGDNLQLRYPIKPSQCQNRPEPRNVTCHDLTELDGREKDETNYNFTSSGGAFQSSRGVYSSGRVPIGGWAKVIDGDCNTGSVTNELYYGSPGFHDNSTFFPRRITDDVATNCSGGSKKNFLPTGDPTFYNQTVNPRRIDQNSTATTFDCYVGRQSATRQNTENCYKAGVHYPSFCQLGDYIETISTCKNDCSSVNSNDLNPNYCNFALDRLCAKQIGDDLKRDEDGNAVQSDKNWIRESRCQNYCGGANQVGSNRCQDSKKDYCKDPDNWPQASNYCYSFWNNPTRFNASDADSACYSKLIDSNSVENITTGFGCGELCQGGSLDVDSDYCNQRRRDYCFNTSQRGNMYETFCFDFCGANPAICESNLRARCGIFYEANLNSDDTINFEGLIDTLEAEAGTGRKFKDFCGCMLPTDVYDTYQNLVVQQFEDAGYTVNLDNSNTNPVCIFPQCKNALKTVSQLNISQTSCPNCFQTILIDINNSELDNIDLEQSANQCGTITAPGQSSEPPPSSTEPPPGTTSPPSSSPPIISLDEENRNKIIIGVVVGILAFVIILYVVNKYSPFSFKSSNNENAFYNRLLLNMYEDF